MDQERAPRTGSLNVIRSIGAVLAGFLIVVIFSLAADVLLRAAGVLPPLGAYLTDGSSALATVYRTLFSVIGSVITARLAPGRPMLHAMIGGCIGLILSIAGAVATW